MFLLVHVTCRYFITIFNKKSLSDRVEFPTKYTGFMEINQATN